MRGWELIAAWLDSPADIYGYTIAGLLVLIGILMGVWVA